MLEVPYHVDRKLVMDVLRHGTDVEVVGPAESRARVLKLSLDAAAPYFERGFL